MRVQVNYALAVTLLVVFPLGLSAADVTGRWKCVMEAQDQKRDYYVDFAQVGGKWTGTFISPRSGDYKIESASVEKGVLRMKVPRKFEDQTFTVEIEGKLNGPDKIEGAVRINGNDFARAVLTRIGNPVGTWSVRSKTPNGERTFESTLRLRLGKNGIEGDSKSERAEVKIKKVKWVEFEKLRISFPLTIGDRTAQIQLDLRFKGNDILNGRWSALDTEYSGEWAAQRKEVVKAIDLAGKWKATASTAERDYDSELTVTRAGDGFKGRYKGQVGEAAYKSVRVVKGEIVLELELVINDNPIAFVVKAKPKGPNELDGRWHVRDREDIGGKWVAKREPKKEPEKKPPEEKKAAKKGERI